MNRKTNEDLRAFKESTMKLIEAQKQERMALNKNEAKPEPVLNDKAQSADSTKGSESAESTKFTDSQSLHSNLRPQEYHVDPAFEIIEE